MYPFSYLSWMREARSCWLVWELLHPFNKERTSIIQKFLNIHEIPTQDILSSFLEPLSCLMFLKIHTESNKETLKQSHSP